MTIMKKQSKTHKAKKIAKRVQDRLAENPEFSLIVHGGAAFASYAATRVVGRIANGLVSRKSPTWGKHAGAVASLGAVGALWMTSQRVESLKPHREALLIGALIAAMQSLVQTYLPAYGWILGDAAQPQLAPAATGEYPSVEPITEDMLDDYELQEALTLQIDEPEPRAALQESRKPIDDDLDVYDDVQTGIFAA